MHDGAFGSHYDPDARTLYLSGEVADGAIRVLGAAVDEHVLAGDGDRRIDFTAVTFLPSEAVSVVIRAMTALRARGDTVQLVAEPGSTAQRVLSVLALPTVEPGAPLPGGPGSVA